MKIIDKILEMIIGIALILIIGRLAFALSKDEFFPIVSIAAIFLWALKCILWFFTD